MNKIEQLISLYKSSFRDSDDYIQTFFSREYDENMVYCHNVNNTIVSALHIKEKLLKIGESNICCGFIFAAATLPDYRRNHLMHIVLKEALCDLRKKGYCLSALNPFDNNYYKKFGYETVFKTKKITLEAKQEDYIVKYYPISVDDVSIIHNLYSESVKNLSFAVCRSFDNMLNKFYEWKSDNFNVESLIVDNATIGYVVYYGNEIEELVLTRIEVLTSLVKFDKYNFYPQSEVVGNIFEEFLQVKVLNYAKFLSNLKYNEKQNFACKIRINDEFLNFSEVLEITLINGEIYIEKIENCELEISSRQFVESFFNKSLPLYELLNPLLKKSFVFCYDKY